MRENTGWERRAYGTTVVDLANAPKNKYFDSGERIPFRPLAGVKESMHALRATRRANGTWTHAERDAATILAGKASGTGWTPTEIGRALGITAQTARKMAIKGKETE